MRSIIVQAIALVLLVFLLIMFFLLKSTIEELEKTRQEAKLAQSAVATYTVTKVAAPLAPTATGVPVVSTALPVITVPAPTTSVPAAPAATATPAPKPAAPSVPSGPSSCPESTMLSPQGEWQPDGRFAARDVVAPQGWAGIIFDGQLVRGGNHNFLVYGPQVKELTYVQGTWYAICPDPVPVAKRIADEKESRNKGMWIQVWDSRGPEAKLLKELNKR